MRLITFPLRFRLHLKMHPKLSLLLIITLFYLPLFSQTVNPQKLEQEISTLNDEHKYDVSITKLNDIINDSDATAYDRYNAYLQKYLTYKRVFNYASSEENLNLALNEGLKTSHKTEVETRVLVERLFLNFDLLRNDEVAKIVPQIKEENLHLLSIDNQAFYVSVLAVLATRKGDYKEAERRLDQAIEMLTRDNPKHLPNIYRKKIALYQNTNEPKKVLDAYKKGVYYAEKYKIDIYRIVMDEAMLVYYTFIKDYKRALEFQKNVIKLRTKYDASNVSSKLNKLEREKIEAAAMLRLKNEQNIRIFLIILAVLLGVIIFILFQLSNANKQKHLLAERENNRMRYELQQLTEELTDKGENELDLNQHQLSERQLEIIELVKQNKTNKEIGQALFISENTVKYHLKVIYEVLGIANRFELK